MHNQPGSIILDQPFSSGVPMAPRGAVWLCRAWQNYDPDIADIMKYIMNHSEMIARTYQATNCFSADGELHLLSKRLGDHTAMLERC